MKWAFWRSETSIGRRADRAARTGKGMPEADTDRADEAAMLRAQTRRRLIGAAVLLLATAAVAPLVLDPLPRPVPESIPIEVRGDKIPFSSKVPLPVPDPAALQGAPPPDAASEGETTPVAAAGSVVSARGADTTSAGAKAGDAQAIALNVTEPRPAQEGAATVKPAADKGIARPDARADAKTSAKAGAKTDAKPEGKPDSGKPAKSASKSDAKFAVQAAAPRSEPAARDLMARLKSAGLPSYVERTETTDGPRWRVRTGPYPTRAEAERARGRLRELGQGADLVVL
jgi:DedD protein